MSTLLLDLEDRIITDTGSTVAKHNLLMSLVTSGQSIDDVPFVPHPDIALYHHLNGTAKTSMEWKQSERMDGPPISSYYWITPEPYKSMNIAEYCGERLDQLGLDTQMYQHRLMEELNRVEDRRMGHFLRCLVWVTDTMRTNQVLWGLGRGSSCASLILFLLGVNKVDPVKYDIPMEEFYK